MMPVNLYIMFIWFGVLESFNKEDLQKLDDLDTAEAIFQSQSTACTETDDLERIQCFRELPLVQYEAFEGDDVIIRCHVAYQKGKVQWAFKGKMLGFDREIPNFPRMRMHGNPNIGDHSLFIENVKVYDSGNYECQLSPSASQPPRRKMTHLIVLKPPTTPVIYRDSRVVKENISVDIVKEQIIVPINLTCVSYGGNPDPTFSWIINQITLSSEIIFRSSKVSITKVNESASIITLRSDQLRSNDAIYCAVFNTATTKRARISDQKIVTKISVIKRIQPGPLKFKEIFSNVVSIIKQEKEQFRLSCVTDEPGDPPVKLTWQTTFDNYPINDYVISNDNTRLFSETTILIPSIDHKWHTQSITCTGTQNGLPSSKPISTIIYIKHFPDRLDVKATSLLTNSSLNNLNSVYIKYDVTIELVCTSSWYFSQKLIMVWYAINVEESKWKQLKTSPDKLLEIDNGKGHLLNSVLKISKSLLQNTALKIPLSVACVLQSQNSDRELRREIKLEEYVQSTSPLITINDERKSAILTNGQSAKIKCSISGGNPTPDLHLVDDSGHEIEGRTYFRDSKNYLDIDVIVNIHDHGKKFKCMTTSKVTLDFVSMSSDFITLNVAIPPSQLTLVSPDSESGYQAYQNVSYRCFTNYSFPESKIQWLWYHTCHTPNMKRLRISTLSYFRLQQFCESEIIQNTEMSSFDPVSYSTISTTTIPLEPIHDHTFLECRVLPHVKWINFNKVLSQIIQLHVLYTPRFATELLNTYVIEEGQNISININASANPPINGYTWLVNQQTMTGKSQIELKVNQFSVISAQPDMMGNYTLLLENPIGKTGFNFFLNVTFPPKLLGPSIETLKLNPQNEYKQKSVLICSAQANPFKDQVRVYWTRELPQVMSDSYMVDILKGNERFSLTKQVHCAEDHWSRGNVSINCISLGAIEVVSSLQIMPMDYRYVGSYKCHFSSNTKTSSVVKTINLVFPISPVPLKNVRKSEYSIKIGGKTEIACYFTAFPTPSIEWIRSTDVRCADSPGKYATSISSPQIGLIKAVLAIRDSNYSDIGTYICRAQNEYGKSTQSVLLNLPRSPTQPMHITFVNASDSSITIGWILGFNGGSKQTIELRWKLTDVGFDTEYNLVELEEIDFSDVQFYKIQELQIDKEYEIIIHSTNRYSNDVNNKSVRLIVRTMKFVSEGDLIQSDGSRFLTGNGKDKHLQDKTKHNNILIIILLCIIGALLVSLKIGLIVYFFGKRRHKHKITNPTKNGYLNREESMEMKPPSLIRSGHDSTIYTQSMSDHMSQTGSESGYKIHNYKSVSYYPSDKISDKMQKSYMGHDIDAVSCSIRGNNFNIACGPTIAYPAFIHQPESSSIIGYHDPYLTNYYPGTLSYQNQAPFSTNQNTALIHYPISSNYRKGLEGSIYPASVRSRSTASGDSNHSLSPRQKISRYSPLTGQSDAPSTVEEYLSSNYSGSDYNKFGSYKPSGRYACHPMTSFRTHETTRCRNSQQDQTSTKGSLFNVLPNQLPLDNDSGFHYSIRNDRQQFFGNAENCQTDQCSQYSDASNGTGLHNSVNIPKLSHVDLISHSSPSVIRITGPISESL